MNANPVFLSAFICALRVCVLTGNLSGPGADYALLGSLAPGLTVQATGRNAGKSWLQGVFLKEGTGDSPRQPMRRHDTVDLQPDKTTVYRLIVIAKDGSEIRRDVRMEVEP